MYMSRLVINVGNGMLTGTSAAVMETIAHRGLACYLLRCAVMIYSLVGCPMHYHGIQVQYPYS